MIESIIGLMFVFFVPTMVMLFFVYENYIVYKHNKHYKEIDEKRKKERDEWFDHIQDHVEQRIINFERLKEMSTHTSVTK